MTDDARIAEIRERVERFENRWNHPDYDADERQAERALAERDLESQAPADLRLLLDRLDAALRENGALRDHARRLHDEGCAERCDVCKTAAEEVRA